MLFCYINGWLSIQVLQYNQEAVDYSQTAATNQQEVNIMSAVANPPPVSAGSIDLKQQELDMLKKEDEEFAALEAKFIAELNLAVPEPAAE